MWLFFSPVTVSVNRSYKCYVMNYCKYSMSFLKIHMNSILASVFIVVFTIFPHMDLILCQLSYNKY